MNKLGYYVFKNAGIKIDLDNFNVLPYDNTFGDHNDIINLTDIPSWDLGDITDMMSESETQAFNDILKKAVKLRDYAYMMLKDTQRILKGISDPFDIDNDMIIELMGLYNLNNRLSHKEMVSVIKKTKGKL